MCCCLHFSGSCWWRWITLTNVRYSSFLSIHLRWRYKLYWWNKRSNVNDQRSEWYHYLINLALCQMENWRNHEKYYGKWKLGLKLSSNRRHWVGRKLFDDDLQCKVQATRWCIIRRGFYWKLLRAINSRSKLPCGYWK